MPRTKTSTSAEREQVRQRHSANAATTSGAAKVIAPPKKAVAAKSAAPAKKAPVKAAPAKKAVAAKPAAPAKKAPAKAPVKVAPAKKAVAAKSAAPPKVAASKSVAAVRHSAGAKVPAKAVTASASTTTAAPSARRTTAAPPPGKAAGATKAPGAYAKDSKFLEHQRQLLESERVGYLEQARSLKAEAEALIEEMEPGDIQFDEESGEGGTVTVDRERDLALSAQALAAVEEIDDALRKIKTGRYGTCEGCGTPIAKARLEALPYARLCIACKSGGLSRR